MKLKNDVWTRKLRGNLRSASIMHDSRSCPVYLPGFNVLLYHFFWQMCSFQRGLSSPGAPFWKEAAPSPWSATPPWPLQAPPSCRCNGCGGRSQSKRRERARGPPSRPRPPLMRNQQLSPRSRTTVWQKSPPTAAARWASTVCRPAATGWGCTRPAWTIRACTPVMLRRGDRTLTEAGTTPEPEPSQLKWGFICTPEVRVYMPLDLNLSVSYFLKNKKLAWFLLHSSRKFVKLL